MWQITTSSWLNESRWHSTSGSRIVRLTFFCKGDYSPFRKRMQCTFSFFWTKNYTFSENVFIFEAGCFVKTVSDEVKKEIDIYVKEAYTFFFRKRKTLLHSFSEWTLGTAWFKSNKILKHDFSIGLAARNRLPLSLPLFLVRLILTSSWKTKSRVFTGLRK